MISSWISALLLFFSSTTILISWLCSLMEAKNKSRADIQDEIMTYRLKSKDRTKQIQAALKKAGFYKGEIDGKEGPQTKRAIKAFQRAKGLNPDGVVGPKTWEELNKFLKD